MSSMGRVTIVLFAIIILLALPLSLITTYDNAIQNQNSQVKQALTNAAYDAVQTATLVDGKAFGTMKQKRAALDVFYTSLSASYYSVLGVNNTTLNAYLPFVMLVDNDGVYVCYSKNYDSYWGTSGSKPEYTDDMYFYTPLAAYSATYTLGGGASVYVVQFTLGDYMTVYKDDKLLVSGNYAHVYSYLKDRDEDFTDSMPFMITENMYIAEKQAIATNIVSNMINKFLNEDIFGNDNVGFNLTNTQYTFVLPEGSTSMQNAISGPTVLSFYHGPQTRLGNAKTAQVALAGGELAKETHYYVTTDDAGNQWYHTADCEHLTGAHTTVFNSMEEAAKAGAYPDPDCIY